MKKIIHKILNILNIIGLFLLIISYLSIFISPEISGIVALIGLAFPLLILINFTFIIYRIIRFYKKMLIVNILVFFIGLSYLSDFIQIKLSANNEDKTEAIKFITYNVRQFNYNVDLDKVTAKNMFMKFFKKEKPDILCIQEFYTRKKGSLNNQKYLQDSVFKSYYFYFQPIKPDSWGEYGISIISKYPIINKYAIFYKGSSNLSIYADILINGDTVRVINNHLESIRFAKEDYKFVDNINLDIDSTKIHEAKNIVSRLIKAFKYRAIQADSISNVINKTKHKLIVCGDFNDTPISYTYHQISKKLKDSFIEAGVGIGNTYNGIFPSYRIDYILHSKDIRCIDYKTYKQGYSDHFPVVAYLKINK